MDNFWDSSVWGAFNLVGVLLISLLLANVLRKSIKPLRESLIPVSVLGGTILLVIAGIYDAVTGKVMFESEFFGGNGYANLELITYHTLALGFIASTLKSDNAKMSKQRSIEIFNTGVTTVSTYLMQASLGMIVTIIAAFVMKDFFSAAGVLLAFGFGQGTGQAMNYGNIYEVDFGFIGGKSFGLTIAAIGFLVAAIGGVIHLNILKKRGLIKGIGQSESRTSEDLEGENEIPMQESIDKMTIQIALIFAAYVLAYLLMFVLGLLLPGMRSVIYGFNFLIGVLAATLVKFIMNLLKKGGAIKKEYTNNFLLTRVSNFFFDIMVTAGIAAIRLGVLQNYWGVIIILGVIGAFTTYFYNRYVAKTLFKEYQEEQFLMMFGMLTGTASTGVILLREKDPDFKSPASDNMVYQNFPAIVFGFPLMLLATLAPVKPFLTLGILIVFFIVLNILLFRSKIFRKKK